MVGVPTAVITHRGPDILRDAADLAEQIVNAFPRQLWVLVERGVEILHVGCVVLVVMDAHRLFIDVRLERVVVVRQRG